MDPNPEKILTLVISLINILLNGGIFVYFVKAIRKFSILEFKIEEMWDDYKNNVNPVVQREPVRQEINKRRRRNDG